MGLWVPNGAGDFQWRVASSDSTRPSPAYGTAFTTGTANVKGSYVQALGALAFDAYGIFIRVLDQFIGAGSPTDMLVDIGVDPAGGSSYSIVIPDLLFTAASNLAHSPSQFYYFPLWIKAGSTVAIRGASVAAANTCGYQIRVFGQPRDRRLIKFGTYVTSFGVVSATSTGTPVTPGTTGDGTYTQIGSALTKSHWWWQVGMGTTSGTNAVDNIYAVDMSIGSASSKQIVIQDQVFCVGSTGAISTGGSDHQGDHNAATGDIVYVRSQCSATPDTGITHAVYGLGG